MTESNSNVRIVLTTVANNEEGERLARILVGEGLAACVTLIPGVRSIYRWQGKIEDAAETMLLLKTDTGQLAALEARLHALHGYETPEFLVLPVEAGSDGYLEWLRANVGKV